jgi:hypothetical protein
MTLVKIEPMRPSRGHMPVDVTPCPIAWAMLLACGSAEAPRRQHALEDLVHLRVARSCVPGLTS